MIEKKQVNYFVLFMIIFNNKHTNCFKKNYFLPYISKNNLLLKNDFFYFFKRRKLIHQKAKFFVQSLVEDILKDNKNFYIHANNIKKIKKIRYNISNNISYIYFYLDESMDNIVISYNIYDIHSAYKIYNILQYYDVPMYNVEEQIKFFQIGIMFFTLLVTIYSVYKMKFAQNLHLNNFSKKLLDDKEYENLKLDNLLSCYMPTTMEKINDFVNLCISTNMQNNNKFFFIEIFNKLFKKNTINNIKPIHKNIILYGNAGTGKTTFASCLRDYLENNMKNFKKIYYIDISATECLGSVFVNSGIEYVKNLFEDIKKHLKNYKNHMIILNINEIEQIFIEHTVSGDFNTYKDDVRNEFKYQLDLLSKIKEKNFILVATSNIEMNKKNTSLFLNSALMSRFFIVKVELDPEKIQNIIKNIVEQYLKFDDYNEEENFLKKKLINDITEFLKEKCYIYNISKSENTLNFIKKSLYIIFVKIKLYFLKLFYYDIYTKNIEEAIMPRKIEGAFIHIIANQNSNSVINKNNLEEFIIKFKKYYDLWF
ncbi:hypothetical protein AB836_00290 [Rickettsiales bacterium (ex Bugula neritina AB1)]|nr:hypothetical protein AB836_00290 [Rickettsiales bacterium (ex Bugula neritina AB1)]